MCACTKRHLLTWRNFLTESLTARPHMIAFTIEAKLSSIRIIAEASFATSVPAIPIEKPTSAATRAGASFVPSPVHKNKLQESQV